jgi:hypothetical protein
MHGKRCYIREIFSHCSKDGELFQGIYSRVHQKNTEVDELAKAATRKMVLPPDVFFQAIKDPSVRTVESEPRMVNIIQGEDWRAPIIAYLCHHYESDNNIELIRM